MKTIILAGGVGKRLQDILKEKPKALLELNGKPLIQYSLKALVKNGIKEVSIVTGYKEDMIKEKMGGNFNKMKINYIKNPLYKTTGTMHGLFCGLEKLEDCLVLDGDIIYEPSVILELINYEKKDAGILTKCCGSGDEVFVTLDENKAVTYLGKQKPSSKNLFEFIGISKFSENFIEKMFELHKENLQKKVLSEYCEDCAYRTSKFVPWYGFIKPDLQWSEIDKKKDIERAKKVIEKLKK